MTWQTHSVRVIHRTGVSRDYYGSEAGWSTTFRSEELSPPYLTNQVGESMEIACSAKGCGMTFMFRLTPNSERMRFFWGACKRRLTALGCGIALAFVSGTLAEGPVRHINWLRIVCFVFLTIGDFTIAIAFLRLLFGGRGPRYSLEMKESGSFEPGTQHGVELMR